MNRMRLVSACALVSIFAGTVLAQPAAEDVRRAVAAVEVEPAANQLRGSISAVTVYRGQALVTRLADLNLQPGLREVVITDLPEQILPGSLFAEGERGAEVRSVRFRTRPLMADEREQVRDLEIKIRAVQDQIDDVQSQQAFDQSHAQYLDKLEAFVAPTSQAELTKGVLNAETLTKLVNYTLEQRSDLSKRSREHAVKMRGLQEQQSLLQRELGQLTARTSRTAREAVVFVNITKPGAGLRVNYLVQGATWSPSYNLRADTAKSAVTVEYQAQVQQLSGEDWADVQMTLSTATPALVASGPTLEPMRLTLASLNAAGDDGLLLGRAYEEVRREIAAKQSEAASVRNLAASGGPSAPSGWRDQDRKEDEQFARADSSLKSLANQAQLLDLLTSEKLEKKPSISLVPAPVEDVSVTYSIAARTSLPSRADQQLIQIARGSCPANFARIATPVLTAYVYSEATITNTLGADSATGSMVMLAGPVSAYRGEEFVGRGNVPTIASGQAFTTGFGIDTTVRTSRELIERNSLTQGGNRVVEFTYRLTVENFSGAAVPVRIVDRMPTSNGSEIKITVVSTGGDKNPLSKDEQYQREQRKLGILRWDATVPANASGPQAFAIEYGYRIEHDRQMTLSEAGSK